MSKNLPHVRVFPPKALKNRVAGSRWNRKRAYAGWLQNTSGFRPHRAKRARGKPNISSPGLKSDILCGKTGHTGRNLPLHRISCAVTLDYNTTFARKLQVFFSFFCENFFRFFCAMCEWSTCAKTGRKSHRFAVKKHTRRRAFRRIRKQTGNCASPRAVPGSDFYSPCSGTRIIRTPHAAPL